MKNLSPRAKKILYAMAQDEARLIGSAQLLPEHLLLALLKLKEGVGYTAFLNLGLNLQQLSDGLESFFKDSIGRPTLDDIPKSRRYQKILDIAEIESSALYNDYIGTEHLVLATVREEGSVAAKFLANGGYTIMDMRFSVMDLQKKNLTSSRQSDMESLVDSVFKSILEDDGKSVFSPLDEEKAARTTSQGDKSRSQKQTFLSEYSRDLTKIARESKDDPVIGRDKEIHRVIQILSRRTKNNPVLTGEPGVGKTAIVEGLAQHIAAGKVPSDLLKKRILSLDLAAIVAGTKYRGEFEERMKRMMRELQENKDIILFIDELHTIIGAGGPEGTMDASNIMKPALSRGEIQIIGATTTKEYTRHIEKDLALERRFQVVKVEEPGDSETEEILRGIKAKYESYHRVIYEEDVIPSIVRLSRRYIPEKVLPDKAIDILDEAGAAKKIQEEAKPAELVELETTLSGLIEEKKALVEHQDYESAALVRDKVIDLKRRLSFYSDYVHGNPDARKTVSVGDIEKIISEMTGIPVEQMTSSESERIIHMEDELHNTVIGQDEAVKVISGAIRRSRAGISSPRHPVGSFIFLGPTGVGKTQLAKALAKYLFGSEDSLIRIDMSDFMEKHTASRLVGAPPGYIGYEEGGVLTEKVRRHPYSVVLLDEIEKAHPDIFNLLLQLLEEGELSDNLGHTVNFRNTVIIMTSNAGARQITNEGRVGFGTAEGVLSYGEIKAGAMNELKKLLSPELLNRIDDVIVFDALSKKQVAQILDIQLAELGERLSEKKLTISITPKAKDYLIEHGYNPAMGARPMKRLLRKEVEDPLSVELLSKGFDGGNSVVIEYEKDRLRVRLVKKNAETGGAAAAGGRIQEGRKMKKSLFVLCMVLQAAVFAEPVRVGILNGPSCIPVAALMAGEVPAEGTELSFSQYADPQALLPKLLKKEADIGFLPLNVAAKVFSSSGKAVRVLAVSGNGNISLITTDKKIKRFSDLKGKEVFVAGQGAVPDYMCRYLLSENKIGTEGKKGVSLSYSIPTAQLAAQLIAGKIDYAVVPEPFVTVAQLKSDAVLAPIDFQKQYKAINGKSAEYPLTVLVITADFAEKNPGAAQEFLAAYEKSYEWTIAHPEQAGTLAEQQQLGLAANVVQNAIPKANFTFVPAAQARDQIEAFLRILLSFDADSVGGELPSSEFYFSAASN